MNIKKDNSLEAVDWLQFLGWNQKTLSDLRSVGYLYVQQGVYSTALKIFNALVVLGSKNLYDLQTIGALHLEMNHPVEALEMLDRALKLDPEHLETKLNQAKALFIMGYKKQAFNAFMELEKCKDPKIQDQASALLLTNK